MRDYKNPQKCPFCKKDFASNVKECIGGKFNHGDMDAYAYYHLCVHCQSPVFVFDLTEKNGENRNTTFIPEEPSTSGMPTRVAELSPNAEKTYRETCKALHKNFNTLVGAGLRIALEHLVTDYLISFKKKDPEFISKLKLKGRIEQMQSDSIYTKACATLVRLYGNDEIHFLNKENIPAEKAMNAFNNLCTIIDAEMQMNDALEKISQHDAK